MEQFKTIRSLPELIFEVALWPSEAGRLLLMGLTPWKAHAAIAKECELSEDKRSKSGLTPTLFWLLIVVAPFFLLFDYTLRRLPPTQVTEWLCAVPGLIRFAAFALFMSAWPVSAAFLLRRESGSRKTSDLKRLIATNCVVQAPAMLVLFSMLMLTFAVHEKARPFNSALLLLFCGLNCYSVVATVMCEVNPKRGRSIRRVLATLSCSGRGLSFGLLVVLAGCMLIMLSTGRLPPPEMLQELTLSVR